MLSHIPHSLWASSSSSALLSAEDAGLLDAVEHREGTGVVEGDLAEGALRNVLGPLELRML